jgi:hypothetical protein
LRKQLTEKRNYDRVTKVKRKKSIRSHHSAIVRLWFIWNIGILWGYYEWIVCLSTLFELQEIQKGAASGRFCG